MKATALSASCSGIALAARRASSDVLRVDFSHRRRAVLGGKGNVTFWVHALMTDFLFLRMTALATGFTA